MLETAGGRAAGILGQMVGGLWVQTVSRAASTVVSWVCGGGGRQAGRVRRGHCGPGRRYLV